jgi:hypothetical protein
MLVSLVALILSLVSRADRLIQFDVTSLAVLIPVFIVSVFLLIRRPYRVLGATGLSIALGSCYVILLGRDLIGSPWQNFLLISLLISMASIAYFHHR